MYYIFIYMYYIFIYMYYIFIKKKKVQILITPYKKTFKKQCALKF